MRFTKYINEGFGYTVDGKKYPSMEHGWLDYFATQWPKDRDLIKKQCKPWLNAIKSCHSRVLFRGISGKDAFDNLSFAGRVRKDRKPKDTSAEVQRQLDDTFERAFGWRPRQQGLFTVRDYSVAASYGAPYLVFPIQKFRFLWSFDIADLYGGLERHPDLAYASDNPELGTELAKKLYTEDPKDLCRALHSGGEIMIGCDYFRAISFAVVREFVDLKSMGTTKYDPKNFESLDDVMEVTRFKKYKDGQVWDHKQYERFIKEELL